MIVSVLRTVFVSFTLEASRKEKGKGKLSDAEAEAATKQVFPPIISVKSQAFQIKRALHAFLLVVLQRMLSM